jgi:membrane-bound metal-dependent hydrolase YbcI (DUF457 family)
MYIGHFAVGLGAKRFAPRISLGTLILAVEFVDMLWPIFLLLGVETVKISPGATTFTPLDFVHYPFTHSLLTGAIWALLFSIAYYALMKYPKGAIVVFLCVISHWFLDLIVHQPDLPLVPWSESKYGLGVWNSVPLTLAIELGMFAIGLTLYLKTTRARDKIGRWAFWALIFFILMTYLGATFGGPPKDENSLSLVALGVWLFVPWGYWIDRHRVIR